MQIAFDSISFGGPIFGISPLRVCSIFFFWKELVTLFSIWLLPPPPLDYYYLFMLPDYILLCVFVCSIYTHGRTNGWMDEPKWVFFFFSLPHFPPFFIFIQLNGWTVNNLFPLLLDGVVSLCVRFVGWCVFPLFECPWWMPWSAFFFFKKKKRLATLGARS